MIMFSAQHGDANIYFSQHPGEHNLAIVHFSVMMKDEIIRREFEFDIYGELNLHHLPELYIKLCDAEPAAEECMKDLFDFNEVSNRIQGKVTGTVIQTGNITGGLSF